MTERSEIAAGLLRLDDPWHDRSAAIAGGADELRWRLDRSTVWQPGHLPPDLRGDAAYGEELARWWPQGHRTADEAVALDAAWAAALPQLDPSVGGALRLRVDSVEAVRQLRTIGSVDGLTIVPSLDSRGRMRPFLWRWPLRIGVVDGPLAAEWLATMQNSDHHATVFDVERYDVNGRYEIAVVAAGDLATLSSDIVFPLGDTTCVIVAGDGPVSDRLAVLEDRVQPAIAVAVAGSPADWWRTLFDAMAHDLPIDFAVETAVRTAGVDALVAGPRRGMDVTAAARWFAAVAPGFPEIAPLLDEFAGWDWRFERGGATTESLAVRALIADGSDPVAFIPPLAMAAPPGMDTDDGRSGGDSDGRGAGPDAAVVVGAEPVPPPSPPASAPAPTPRGLPPLASRPGPRRAAPKPRRLVVRVFDGDQLVKKILPPNRDFQLAVRIAVPQRSDVAADAPAPELPAGPGPTVDLTVVVCSDVWEQQPPAQTISISRKNLAQPSSWAVFPFTTPAAGNVVNIDVTVLYRGKPLQAATFVSPVRALALPFERPTLTTFALSGPSEPSDESRPVNVTLDGTGAELKHLHGSDGRVLVTEVQGMLDRIEDRVSRVLGVPGAPDALDHPRVVELLITLAGIGTELDTFLAPLAIGDARSINVMINPLTKVLPLEMVYAGPPPDDTAKLCDHVADPPPPGQACTRASARKVCPYAFWGLHRTISRTIRSDDGNQPHWSSTVSAASVLYAATSIADEDADTPAPSRRALAAAEQMFSPVVEATSWREWRKVVKASNPNLLVVLGHTMVEGGRTNLYIGKDSALDRRKVSARELSTDGSRRPLVLLIACSTAALGDPFGSLPGAWTAKGAGAVVGTLSKIVGPQGATAVTHLLEAIHDVSERRASVGDAVAAARRSLIVGGHPIGLTLVTHGELDTLVGA